MRPLPGEEKRWLGQLMGLHGRDSLPEVGKQFSQFRHQPLPQRRLEEEETTEEEVKSLYCLYEGKPYQGLQLSVVQVSYQIHRLELALL